MPTVFNHTVEEGKDDAPQARRHAEAPPKKKHKSYMNMNEKEYLNHVIRPSQQRANAKKLAEIEYLEQLKKQEDHAMTVALGSRSSSRLSARRLHEGEAGIQNASYILSTLGGESHERKSENEWGNLALQSWEDFYEAVVAHRSRTGAFPTRGPLNIWIESQKKNMRHLQTEKKHKFQEMMGMRLPSLASVEKTKVKSKKQQDGETKEGETNQQACTEPSWEDQYASIVRFKNACGVFPKSGRLYEWLQQQLMDWKKLPSDKRERLSVIGVEGSNGGHEKDTPTVWWSSTEAVKLFGCEVEEGESVDVQKSIKERIEILKKVNQTPDGWKSVVPRDDIVDKYTQHNIQNVRHRAMYLIRAYDIALKEMSKKTFGECCEMASKELGELGISKAGSHLIGQLNIQFRKDHQFPHPKKLLEDEESTPKPDIFDYFPRAKEMFLDLASNNLDQLTGKWMMNEVATTILPELERESKESGCFNDGSPAQNLLGKYITKPPSVATVRRWLKKFNIQYDHKCTQRGRGGISSVSRSMKEAWASGKFANRRPKGQGLQQKKDDDGDDAEEEADAEAENIDQESDEEAFGDS